MSVGALQPTGDYLATCDADMRLKPRHLRVVEMVKRVMDVQRGAGSSQRIVVVRLGCSEQRHHGVADVLVDGAFVFDNDVVN